MDNSNIHSVKLNRILEDSKCELRANQIANVYQTERFLLDSNFLENLTLQVLDN